MCRKSPLTEMDYEQLLKLKNHLEEQRDIMQANADELDQEVFMIEVELERRDYVGQLF